MLERMIPLVKGRLLASTGSYTAGYQRQYDVSVVIGAMD